MLVDHPRVGRLSPRDYDRWLTGRSQLVQPGVPLWAAVSVQFGEQVGQQSDALAETLSAPPDVDSHRLETLVQLACVRGFRGIVVRTSSPLDDGSPQARHRAAVLELLNRQLQLVEPWIASGKVVGQIESTDSNWTGVVLLVDRARLLVPIAAEVLAGSQHAKQTPDSAHLETAFVVPGIPESCQVYLLSATSMRPLATQRVAGGTRIVLPAHQAGMILLTEDPKVVQSFRQHVTNNSTITARLMRNAIEQEAKQVGVVGRELQRLGYATDNISRAVASAEFQLRQYDTLMASGRADAASELADMVDRNVQLRAGELRQLARLPSALVSHPLSLGFEQLFKYAQYSQSSTSLRGGENLLYGGDFEDLGQMIQFGWRHVTDESLSVESRVTLAANGPQHGRHCLEMIAAPTPQSSSNLLVTSARFGS